MHLPAGIWKSPPFKIGLALQIVFAIFILLANPASAAAQFEICNDTKQQVTFAWSSTWADEDTHAVQTMVTGYSTLASDACAVVSPTSILNYHVYLFAWETNHPKRSWTGPNLRCGPSFAKVNFRYVNRQASPPCGAGQMQLGMFQCADGSQTNFTETLTESTQTSLPKRPPRRANQPL